MLSPLNYSIINGHTEIALYLLDKGASIYLTDCMGFNTLHYACKYNNKEIHGK